MIRLLKFPFAVVLFLATIGAVYSVQDQDRSRARASFLTQSCDIARLKLETSQCVCDTSLDWLPYCLLVGLERSPKGYTFVLRDFMENLSNETVQGPESRDLESSFQVTVNDPGGSRLLTNGEILLKSCKRNGDFRPCYSLLRNQPRPLCIDGPCSDQFPPFTSIARHFDRDNLFTFASRGVYEVTVLSKLKFKQKELEFQFHFRITNKHDGRIATLLLCHPALPHVDMRPKLP